MTRRTHQPVLVTLDPSGNLYIADQRNHRVRLVATDGTISTVAGDGVAGFAGGASPRSVMEEL